MNTTMMTAPKWYEPSTYKLYVCPVAGFDKISLMKIFSQYAEVVDAYVSDPNPNGFKWSFIYFATEEGLLEATRKVEENNVHNFKLNRAKPKIFQLPGSVPSTDTSVCAKILNDVNKTNGVSFVTPPNCAHCKKLTFQQCISCKNSFCSTECSLDGWRMHTSSCIKVAELVKLSESNGAVISNTLAPTVINFMKDCKYSKKKFTTVEFAEACNFRGMISVTSDAKEESVSERETNITIKQPHSSNFDKNKRSAESFLKLTQPTIDSNKVDNFTPLTNGNKSASKASFKKHTKYDESKDRVNRPIFQNSTPQKSNSTDYTKANTEGDENWDLDDSKHASLRKLAQKYTDKDDAEATVNRKPTAKLPNQKKGQKGFDKNEAASVKNSHCNDVADKKITFMPKSTNEQSIHPVKRCEPKISVPPPETDLKLKEKCSARVMVASIVNEDTFYIADPLKIVNVLKQIMDCAHNAPKLNNAKVNIKCLAFFDGEWYRAKILSTNPIEVEYIDYGNKEICEIENLKQLPESLSEYLPLASKVKLHQSDVQQSNIREYEEIDIYVRSYESRSNSWIIDVL